MPLTLFCLGKLLVQVIAALAVYIPMLPVLWQQNSLLGRYLLRQYHTHLLSILQQNCVNKWTQTPSEF